MKVLVTGVSGFVGRALVAESIKHGLQIKGEFHVTRQLMSNMEKCNVGLIDGQTNWEEALYNVNAVIHLAARVHVMNDSVDDPLTEFRKVNVDGSLHLALQAAKAGVRRFIFISSVKVNGEYTVINKPFTEDDICSPQDAYGLSKFEAEQGLLLIAQQTGMEVVIIRPPLVYGVGVKANFASMLQAVKRGIPLPLGAIHNQRSFVYVGNLVSLILRCLDHPAAANQVFLVSDGHDLSTTEMLSACALAFGVKSRLFPIPQRLIKFAADVLGKRAVAQRLCGNLQVDITKAQILLGWLPPISVADGLKATALGLIQGEE